ncbi:MAG: Ig-like domain-containing protein [Candidatus Sericytochromatia bacterium]|nr:Ig-like domain-containing protein [Candidatus Tanganyikabacteria bacterium]
MPRRPSAWSAAAILGTMLAGCTGTVTPSGPVQSATPKPRTQANTLAGPAGAVPAGAVPAAVATLSVMPQALSLKTGQHGTLFANVVLSNGVRNGNVIWSSTDDSRAIVDRWTGEVIAVAPGDVALVASYVPDPLVKAMVVVTITDPASPSSTGHTSSGGPPGAPPLVDRAQVLTSGAILCRGG